MQGGDMLGRMRHVEWVTKAEEGVLRHGDAWGRVSRDMSSVRCNSIPLL